MKKFKVICLIGTILNLENIHHDKMIGLFSHLIIKPI